MRQLRRRSGEPRPERRARADIESDALAVNGGRPAGGAAIILAAAIAAIGEHGYHGASMREIAERAGLSVAALYHHFATKQELLVEVMHRAHLLHVEALEHALAAAPADPASRLSFLIGWHTIRHIATPFAQRWSLVLISEQRSLEPPHRTLIECEAARRLELFGRVVYEGVEAGVFRTRYPDDAARSLLALGSSVASWYCAEDGRDPKAVAGAYIELALALVQCDVPDGSPQREPTAVFRGC